MTSILVVDDAPAVAASAVTALRDAGYVTRVATSVDAAQAELADVPDVVVLDHVLDRDATLLRHRLVHLRVPVLLVSGLDDDAARPVAEAHGWRFLAKPFDDVALVAAVASLLTPETPSMPDRTTPDPRPSVVPDPTPAPLPPPPPAAAYTPSGRPLNVPTAVQVIDRLGDIVGVIVIGLLCHAGKLGGEVAVIAIGAILGVGTGLRQVGARAGVPTGVGVVGLLLLGAARWLAPAAGAAELARGAGLLGVLAALALAGCPKLPPVSGCEPLSQRCEGDRPQVCSPSRRWHTVGDEACGATPGQSCQVRNGVAGVARGGRPRDAV